MEGQLFFFPSMEKSQTSCCHCDTFFFLSCSYRSSFHFASLLPSISSLPLSSILLLLFLFPQSTRTTLSSSCTVTQLFLFLPSLPPLPLHTSSTLSVFLSSLSLLFSFHLSTFPFPWHSFSYFFNLPITLSCLTSFLFTSVP